MTIYNLVSFVGLFALMGFAWCLSSNRRKMNWHLILWGVGLQSIFAFLIFVVFPTLPEKHNPFLWLNDAVFHVIASAGAGAEFVFGPLANPKTVGFVLAFQAFPTIIFFSALMSILYFCNIMPKIIRAFSYVFTKLMRISGAESLCASSNIFVGVESALTVKPHLNEMTRSELCTVLTAGMATVASNVMVLYVNILGAAFPMIAGHLISASILSAPAALIMSKILLPETESPVTLGRTVAPHYEREASLFEAIINGANAGMKLIFGIVALLIAVLGLVALANLILGGISDGWSLQGFLGDLFAPLTLLLGVPPEETLTVSKLIGERMVVTEVVSYQNLAAALKTGALSPRSAVIASYALCGFAHLASMAIFVGGISALAPKKTRELAQVGLTALVAATLACLMTGCIAGVFFTDGSLLLGTAAR